MRLAIRTRLLHFRHDNISQGAMEYIPDGVLVAEEGVITLLDHAESVEKEGFDLSQCQHYPDDLMLAGFVDTHVHAPQMDVMGSYGAQLLDWLKQYTFPEEMLFADKEYAAEQAERFINQLLANGTTSAMVFTTSFAHSTDSLFDAAWQKDLRLIAGKVMMDRNAPEGLLDTAQSSYKDSRWLIDKWHAKGRLGYAITPRFAGTSTREQLELAGKLISENDTLWMQTHLSENKDEIEWTRSLFPDAKDYLDVYDQFGLVNERSIFAHCIHLTQREKDRMAEQQSKVAFCPSSNLFLGSGLLDVADLKKQNIQLSLASDVGGGTSLSPFKTMGDAYKVCQLNQYSLAALEAFYLASLGAARTLGLENKIGNLAVGTEADCILLSAKALPNLAQRLKKCSTIEEELFVYMTLGDERLIRHTYIAGHPQYINPAYEEAA